MLDRRRLPATGDPLERHSKCWLRTLSPFSAMYIFTILP